MIIDLRGDDMTSPRRTSPMRACDWSKKYKYLRTFRAYAGRIYGMDGASRLARLLARVKPWTRGTGGGGRLLKYVIGQKRYRYVMTLYWRSFIYHKLRGH